MHGQLTQAKQHFAGIAQAVMINCPALLFQRQQVLRPRVRNHPFTPGHSGNLGGLDRLPVPAPTIERHDTPHGVIWRVTYAGMVREHRQDWQAWCWYEMACAAYAARSIFNTPNESEDDQA